MKYLLLYLKLPNKSLLKSRWFLNKFMSTFFWKLWDHGDSLSATDQAWRKGRFQKIFTSHETLTEPNESQETESQREESTFQQPVGSLPCDINHKYPLWKQTEMYCSPVILYQKKFYKTEGTFLQTLSPRVTRLFPNKKFA